MMDGAAQALDIFLAVSTDKGLRTSPVGLRWVDQTPQEIFVNDRLRIASILLGHLITCDQGKDLRTRLPEVRHCIDLADLLIGLCETSTPICEELDGSSASDRALITSTPAATQNPLPVIAKQVFERRRASLQDKSLRDRPSWN